MVDFDLCILLENLQNLLVLGLDQVEYLVHIEFDSGLKDLLRESQFALGQEFIDVPLEYALLIKVFAKDV